ncbi:hypothetical protein [Flaviflagellibacter deserti]|uniref:Uncharacterized protein n=1 Tax=Flaviflagellibacter deserti TaxID=2267266 RepID=A0ABV9YXG4_9HYPH
MAAVADQLKLEKGRLLGSAGTPPAGTARVGIWQCQLPFETLTWTSAVYDLFELPRGFRVTREEALGFYTKDSREILEEVRTRAIQDGTGFTLDAEIMTALGKPRLMRITATVEYEIDRPVRIWGTKQDITPTGDQP